MKNDYADRSPWLWQGLEEHDHHWHNEVVLVRKGFIAMIVLALFMLVLSAVTYAAQPAAPKHSQSVSVMSLVDDKGGE